MWHGFFFFWSLWGVKHDKFIKNLYPQAVLHFEDFDVKNAGRILEKYRPSIADVSITMWFRGMYWTD